MRLRLQKSNDYNFITNESLLKYDNISSNDFIYDTYAQSEQIRITKSCKAFGISISPINEKQIILLLSDGRLLVYDLIRNHQQQQQTFTTNEAQIEGERQHL